MTRHIVTLAVAMCACALSQEPPSIELPVAPDESRSRRAATPPLRTPGVRGLVEELRQLQGVPDDPLSIPTAAREPLRALRRGLRSWLLDAVRAAGRVPSRVELRAILDEAELTRARVGEDLSWGSVTRIDVVAPSESLVAVIIGLRLSCASDDALYVFEGSRLLIELAQDQWESLSDARSDLRVTQSRAARNAGALLVSSRSERCASRWQAVRFEGLVQGPSPERPTARWSLRHSVDTTGECGGFDEATLGVVLSRNGFELHGCEPSTEGAEPRSTRLRYVYTHEGIEPAAPVIFRRNHRR